MQKVATTTVDGGGGRIAKNTAMLYIRMLLVMAAGLYTGRVVLRTLGVTDYGIYNVVGGVVAMFAFLNNAMTLCTQRYLNYESGRGNGGRLRTVFATSLLIHALISAATALLCETVGLWLLLHRMTIPPERTRAAFWVLQLSIVSTVAFIMGVPYSAAMIARERMGAFALISILEVTLKLLTALILQFCPIDRLILYAALMAAVQILVRAVYSAHCRRRYPETRIFLHGDRDTNPLEMGTRERDGKEGKVEKRERGGRKKWEMGGRRGRGMGGLWDRKLFVEMLGFSGWSLFGNFAQAASTQGVNLLLNVFFNPAVNAARGVAVQVQAAVTQFSTSFQTAVNPRITKSFATGDIPRMTSLVLRSSRLTFFLLLVLILPVLLETDFILGLWLGAVPEYTVPFLRLTLLTTIVTATANPLTVTASATGRIRLYQAVLGAVILAVLPVSWIALRSGAGPVSVFTVTLAVHAAAFAARLFLVGRTVGLSVADYLCKVILRCLTVAVLALIPPLLLTHILPHAAAGGVSKLTPPPCPFIHAAAVCGVAVLSTVLSVMMFGLTRSEIVFLKNKMRKFTSRQKGGE